MLLLKGGALIKTVYRDQPGLRPLGDLDLLVKTEDLPGVEEVLRLHGCRPLTPSSAFFPKGSVAFDLYTDLVGAGRIRRRALAFHFDQNSLARGFTPRPAGPDATGSLAAASTSPSRRTGFGAIYQENITLTRPGGEWDQLLLAYCRGEREQPPWGIGEIAFHGNSQAGKELYHVQTIFAVQEATPTAVLAAMREGHMYALQRAQEDALVLRNFTLAAPTAAERARMGEALRLHDSPIVYLRLETESQSPLPFSLTLIRSGTVIATFSGTTPQDFTYRDDSLREGRSYYRVEVRGPTPHWLVSNPNFVEKTAL